MGKKSNASVIEMLNAMMAPKIETVLSHIVANHHGCEFEKGAADKIMNSAVTKTLIWMMNFHFSRQLERREVFCPHRGVDRRPETLQVSRG